MTAKDKKGVSALHYAAGQGRLEVIKFLYSKGVDLDSDDPGMSACTIFCLIPAFYLDHSMFGMDLLQTHVTRWSSALTTGGRTPLHWAVLGNQTAAVSFLLAKGAWVEASDAHDDTPLHLAARQASLYWHWTVLNSILCILYRTPYIGQNIMPPYSYADLWPQFLDAPKCIAALVHRCRRSASM